MINFRSGDLAHTTTVTFSLDTVCPVSVVGDFNAWDPLANPLAPRVGGLRWATVTVPTGTELRFRYLADGGQFFDDADADALEPNGFGATHGVVRTSR